MDHPSEDTLKRFAAGTGSREENRAVVVHLLKGCPACARILRVLMEPDRIARADYEEPLDRFDQSLLQGLESSIDPLETLRAAPSGILLDRPQDVGLRKNRCGPPNPHPPAPLPSPPVLPHRERGERQEKKPLLLSCF
jgi:hypothetical protein